MRDFSRRSFSSRISIFRRSTLPAANRLEYKRELLDEGEEYSRSDCGVRKQRLFH